MSEICLKKTTNMNKQMAEIFQKASEVSQYSCAMGEISDLSILSMAAMATCMLNLP